MVRHTDRVEADLQRYYGVALGDLFAGGLSWRRLGVLIAALPPESATMSALAVEVDASGVGVAQQWTVAEHLLASVVDLLGVLIHTTAQVHSSKRLPPPEPLPRPGMAATAPRPRMSEESKARIRARLRGAR